MKWFVTYDGKVDEDHTQFGPLATQEAALRVREVIEVVEGHEDLWVVQDDDHLLTYDRDLTAPRVKVHVRDTPQDVAVRVTMHPPSIEDVQAGDYAVGLAQGYAEGRRH